LDGLLDSFGEETISDDYVRNYNNVVAPSNETDHDRRVNFDRNSDTSDDKNYSMKPVEKQRIVLSI